MEGAPWWHCRETGTCVVLAECFGGGALACRCLPRNSKMTPFCWQQWPRAPPDHVAKQFPHHPGITGTALHFAVRYLAGDYTRVRSLHASGDHSFLGALPGATGDERLSIRLQSERTGTTGEARDQPWPPPRLTEARDQPCAPPRLTKLTSRIRAHNVGLSDHSALRTSAPEYSSINMLD